MKVMQLDLVILGGSAGGGSWRFGASHSISSEPSKLEEEFNRLLATSTADVFVFWDSRFPIPSGEWIAQRMSEGWDCLHAGLRLGTHLKPAILRGINPSWMFDADAPADIESTSWRISLHACVVTTNALRKLGGPRSCFQSLGMAGLEMGHRWIRNGALMRYVPELLPSADAQRVGSFDPSLVDELTFALQRSGSKWPLWALGRWVLAGKVGPIAAGIAWNQARKHRVPSEPPQLRPVKGICWAVDEPPLAPTPAVTAGHKVSVLIPTVDRYPYLRTLLTQLRDQTVRPFEIIIVDQTRKDRREPHFKSEYPDLPIIYIEQDEPGQCSSRNAGLMLAGGDFILFIDDDDEVRRDLIERHLVALEKYAADVSCGVAEEVGAGGIPSEFRQVRASDVFPTNNALVRRHVLEASGLFDLAYNKRQRADGDLGCRMYLSGARMVLDPTILVLHHHAPSGGLRKHKARVVTYAMSRSQIFCKALCSASELYLSRRYFPEGTDREVLWMSLLGTFSYRGNVFGKMIKCLYALFSVPHSVWVLKQRNAEATEMMKQFPIIPQLSPRKDPLHLD